MFTFPYLSIKVYFHDGLYPLPASRMYRFIRTEWINIDNGHCSARSTGIVKGLFSEELGLGMPSERVSILRL
jgi:hypothetical protein|nr:hypothetical protein Q903MT_gene2195 [Picea sitchensis]